LRVFVLYTKIFFSAEIALVRNFGLDLFSVKINV